MHDLNENNAMINLIIEIEKTVKKAKGKLASSVNSIITETYWTIGNYIIEYEQGGAIKSEYGTATLTEISKQLSLRLGKGYSRPNLNNMRKRHHPLG